MNKKEQKLLFESGNELAAYAAKQIDYHVMGYYPITPSTQIAEYLDRMGADGEHNIALIPAEGEHSAAGICYGASAGGGRVFNATSANGLLYAIEQLPIQSGTRLPMVLNIACRTVSGVPASSVPTGSTLPITHVSDGTFCRISFSISTALPK